MGDHSLLEGYIVNMMRLVVLVAVALFALSEAAPKGRHKPRYQDFALGAIHTYGPKVKSHYHYGDHTVGLGSFGFTRTKGYTADFGGGKGHGNGYHIQPYSYRNHEQLFKDFGIDDHADIISYTAKVHPKSAFAYTFQPVEHPHH